MVLATHYLATHTEAGVTSFGLICGARDNTLCKGLECETLYLSLQRIQDRDFAPPTNEPHRFFSLSGSQVQFDFYVGDGDVVLAADWNVERGGIDLSVNEKVANVTPVDPVLVVTVIELDEDGFWTWGKNSPPITHGENYFLNRYLQSGRKLSDEEIVTLNRYMKEYL